MPFSMFKGRINIFPAAGSINYYHKCNCHTPEDIQGDKSAAAFCHLCFKIYGKNSISAIILSAGSSFWFLKNLLQKKPECSQIIKLY
jgi:hypothetical protein